MYDVLLISTQKKTGSTFSESSRASKVQEFGIHFRPLVIASGYSQVYWICFNYRIVVAEFAYAMFRYYIRIFIRKHRFALHILVRGPFLFLFDDKHLKKELCIDLSIELMQHKDSTNTLEEEALYNTEFRYLIE